ncbi:MAG: HEAT repeat domain-containing protein [Myxococcales bacterium]|nr:HEAT repeat domain-containing protein [Myxococcales bacterium]
MRRLARPLCAVALLFAALPAAAFTWPNAAETIEKQLDKTDVSARRRAARRLSELSPTAQKRLVQKALVDADADVRLAAADLVLERRLRGTGELVVGWLNDPERRIRLSGAEILRMDPVTRAVAPLGRVLGDPDPAVRSAAAGALGASGTKDAVLPLLGHLDDSVPAVRSAVARALAKLGDPRAVVPLIGKVQDSRPAVRRSVARALGELGDVRASSALILSLRDGDEAVRVAAVEALGALGDPQATLAIGSLASADASPAVRAAVVNALSHIGTGEALDTLLSLMASEQSPDTLLLLRKALARAGAKASERLDRCLAGQPEARVADNCALALAEMGKKDSAKLIVSALRRGALGAPAALSALETLGDKAALPTVLEHLGDPDPGVRRAAIDAAVALLDPKHPDGRAVDPIAQALEKARSSKAERAALARLLGRTGSPRAVKALAPLAGAADNVELRVAAIDALGMLPPSGQDRVLLEALDADEASVRLAAAVALRRAASGAAARTLLDRLERSAEQDRAALAVALGGALGRGKAPGLVERTHRLMLESRGGQRDALLEAMGRLPSKEALRTLAEHARETGDLADRAKIAEALAARSDGVALLGRLAADVDGSVRANAVWSLGSVGRSGERATIVRALDDEDVAVAGNAAAALGRVGARTRSRVDKELCARLADSRAYVRANALAGLRVAGARCSSHEEIALLTDDRAEVVRRAAALLVANVKSADAARDQRLLETCALEDPDSSVAAACAQAPVKLPATTDPVLVYIVPMGESAPVPRTPFALVRADGLMRLGLADRRGQVFEHDAPTGEVSLAVPAPLAR